jgi:hypothetical protein
MGGFCNATREELLSLPTNHIKKTLKYCVCFPEMLGTMQANGFLNFKIRYFADKLKFFIQIRYC